MDEWTDRDSDAVAAETISRLCYWLIKSNFDIWNSASRASLTKMKESISRSLGHYRSSLLSSKGFSATAETAACTDSHRQHVCGFVYKYTRRVEIAPRVGSDVLEPLALRESGGGSVRQEREHALPVVLHSPLTSRWPAARPYAFPPIKKCCRWCYERSGWSEHQWYSSPRTSLGSQTWRNCWRHRLADPRQEVYAIPGGGLGVALEPGTMESSCVIASGVSEEMGALQSRTLMGARKPSTRRLYASKWECLWKSQAHIDPTTCTVSYVLSFPLHRLDSGSLPSTLKVYVAAIAMFVPRRAGNRSVKKTTSPMSTSFPPWDQEVG